MKTDDMSRRSLLQAIAATIVALPVGWAEIGRLAHESRAAAQLAGAAKISVLSAAEAADIEAVTAQIIPTDDTPGAREAGVVYFVDRALATFLSQLASDYRAQLTEQTSSMHLLGTCRMSNDPATSVVDRYHRSYDIPNLFVCDGSSLVTSGRGQPTMTIQALAFRAASTLRASRSAARSSVRSREDKRSVSLNSDWKWRTV